LVDQGALLFMQARLPFRARRSRAGLLARLVATNGPPYDCPCSQPCTVTTVLPLNSWMPPRRYCSGARQALLGCRKILGLTGSSHHSVPGNGTVRMLPAPIPTGSVLCTRSSVFVSV